MFGKNIVTLIKRGPNSSRLLTSERDQSLPVAYRTVRRSVPVKSCESVRHCTVQEITFGKAHSRCLNGLEVHRKLAGNRERKCAENCN